MDSVLDMGGVDAFLARVHASSYFEEAAAHTLAAMLSEVEGALVGSVHSQGARMARGMVHLRPSDGYRQLVVLEAGAHEAVAPEPGSTRLPSMTAWRLVAKHRCAAAIDVNFGRIEPEDSVAPAEWSHAFGNAGSSQDKGETRQRLLERGTTHVYVLPLRGAGGAIEGMISLEAECRAAVGQPFIWSACASRLRTLADIATPHLTALPLRPVVTEEQDPLLPVQGEAMKGLVRMLRVFALQDETILLSGATGTGKSRLARWCHERSPYRKGPFEVLDLSTVPEDLQLAELFGWRKGAFTGAARDHGGAVERAAKGTLFIDEIDKLSMRAQAGLLYMLETRAYRVLGDSGGERRAQARFIVGTNANLQAAVRAQRFREDLYYRINVLPVRLPALSERPDEIPAWARFMLERRHRERDSAGSVDLTSAAERRLLTFAWPGNLRQLDNVMRRAYTVALAEQGGVQHAFAVDEPHLTRALAYEDAEPSRSLVELLHAAATAFVREAERRAALGTPLELDLANVFPGMVLAAATEKLENRDEAFRLFGRDAQVKSRNHHRVLRRELERVEALFRALGIDSGSPFGRLLDGLAEDG
ncbi:sigma 54-interacting transcriptional regulator [Pendulispora brunnea]|uniref:Sigma 54-interacting transcriptional regulator n=1 Tax=Pendulispora brunnea TaxID=2905690 RepID=A0ABZ2KCR3_9BACT